jgi:tetratricopeptide (TPR) repeat protein
VRLAASLEELAVQKQKAGDAAAAEALLRSALVLRDGARGAEGGVGAVPALDALAALCAARGADDEAAALLERALREVEGAGADPREVADRLRVLAEVHAGRGDPAAAEPLLERALALAREGGVGGQELAVVLKSLAGAESALGRHDEAERRLREALAVVGVDPLLRQLAVELAAQGRAAEAAAIAGRLEDAAPAAEQLPRNEPPRLPQPAAGGPSTTGPARPAGTALEVARAVEEPSPVAPSRDGIKLFAAAAALTIVRSAPLQETDIARLGTEAPPALREQLAIVERHPNDVPDNASTRVSVLRRHRVPIAAAAAVVVVGLVAGQTVGGPGVAADDARASEAAGVVGSGGETVDSAVARSGRPAGEQGEPVTGSANAPLDTPFVVVMPNSAQTAGGPPIRDDGPTRTRPVRRRSALPSTISIDTRAVDESLRGRAESAMVRLPAIARPQGPLPQVDGRVLGGRPPR